MLKRLLRHLFAPRVRKIFPQEVLDRITQAVADGERRHSGEVVFAIETRLSLHKILRNLPARAWAEEAFAHLRVWDTEANNGVLIYLLMADRRLEIVADRGLTGKISGEQWREVAENMEKLLAAGKPGDAAVSGIEAVSALLAKHFPRDVDRESANELPDEPRVLK